MCRPSDGVIHWKCVCFGAQRGEHQLNWGLGRAHAQLNKVTYCQTLMKNSSKDERLSNLHLSWKVWLKINPTNICSSLVSFQWLGCPAFHSWPKGTDVWATGICPIIFAEHTNMVLRITMTIGMHWTKTWSCWTDLVCIMIFSNNKSGAVALICRR